MSKHQKNTKTTNTPNPPVVKEEATDESLLPTTAAQDLQDTDSAEPVATDTTDVTDIEQPQALSGEQSQDNGDEQPPVTQVKSPDVVSTSTRFGAVSDSVVSLLSNLEEYVVKMRPGHMVGDRDGAIQQQRLYRTIKTAMALPDVKDFREAMDGIMACIAEHRNTCFGEYHVFRFIENVTLSADDRKEFERLLHLLITLAPAEGRKNALTNQLDLNVILVNVKQEEVKQRFVAYLQRHCGIN